MNSPPSTSDAPLVSIIIPVFNRWEYTFKCLMALVHNTRSVSHETLLVDNGSSDDTRLALPRLENVHFHRNENNLGFAVACNQGASMALGKYLLFLNNDTEVQPNWLSPMVELMENEPSVEVVGNKLLYPDGTIQHAGIAFSYANPFPISTFHLHHHKPADASQERLELSAVTGACLLIRAETFRAVGGFDEGFVNGYEDVDLCLKVRERGGRIAYTPESVVIHHESKSQGRFEHVTANADRLHRKWLEKFDAFDVDVRDSSWANDPDPSRPSISVVVVTHNSLATIAPCLESMALNVGPKDEIIVVDTESTDCTIPFVQLFAREHPGLVRIVPRPKSDNGLAAAQAGLQAAEKELAVVLRSNVRIPQNGLDMLISRLPAAGAVGVPSGEVEMGVLAAKSLLAELGDSCPDALFCPTAFGLSQALSARGMKLVRVPEVAVRPVLSRRA